MDLRIEPQKLSGTVAAIPSKSIAHRLLILSAFADRPTTLLCPQKNRDMEATAHCLRALGAEIQDTEQGFLVTPASKIPEKAMLPCGESGSTLRFLLPVAGALGVDATFSMEGRLPQRPLSPLWEVLEEGGCKLTRPTKTTLRCSGRLRPGAYAIDGGVSSQFITGLLFAQALMGGQSTLNITGNTESAPYIALTRQALDLFSAQKGRPFLSPGTVAVEGDWSNAAFFLAAKALGSPLTVTNLALDSLQGDRASAELLPLLTQTAPTIDARDIPDLVPILAVTAGACHGAVFTNIRRLRLKESDRVATIIALLEALGGKAQADENTLTVSGVGFRGGAVDAAGDHRIAMAAAIAATVCREPVVLFGAEAVNKSYPTFWAEFARLGGSYEQYLR